MRLSLEVLSTVNFASTSSSLILESQIPVFPETADRVTRYPSAFSIGDKVSVVSLGKHSNTVVTYGIVSEISFTNRKVYYSVYIHRGYTDDNKHLFEEAHRINSLNILPYDVYALLTDRIDTRCADE